MQTAATQPPRKMKVQRGDIGADHSVQALTPYKVIGVIVLIILAILFLFPLYWIITGSFKSQQVINAAVPQWFPLEPTIGNYQRLFEKPAMTWVWNTVFMCVMSMGLTCITASMGGYALAKKHFAGNRIIFSIFIIAMALPKQVILIPLLKEMAWLRLHNTLWAVILPTVGWPFGVFLMRQSMMSVNDAYMESAYLDGASLYRIFFQIMLPMVMPTLSTMVLLSFMGSWNSYLWPLIVLTSTDKQTLQVVLGNMNGMYKNNEHVLMAGAVLTILPILIVYLVSQRYVDQGISLGGLK